MIMMLVMVMMMMVMVMVTMMHFNDREATSDRITLGVTAVLTLSAISLDSRSDLPKVIILTHSRAIRSILIPTHPFSLQVHYATALDWFIICSFLYCMASILEFAGVHYFTKVQTKLV